MSNASDTDASHAPAPSSRLGPLVNVPPFLIITSTAALAYTQAPNIAAQMTRLFAPPLVVATPAPEPPIDRAPVAKIAPEPPPPAPQAAEVITPQPLPVVKHAAKKPVARAPHERVVYVRTSARGGILITRDDSRRLLP